VLLHLRDPAYTERLASFLRSLGQSVAVPQRDTVELEVKTPDPAAARLEVEMYLRVWKVLYPEADVEISA
jgi:hypothetical protein